MACYLDEVMVITGCMVWLSALTLLASASVKLVPDNAKRLAQSEASF